jgi:hypothetical protein
MENMNYLTSGDLALFGNRNYGGCYDGYGYHHKGNAMGATGIGLAAGLGGGALLLAIAGIWGVNQASKARAKSAENLANANMNYINQVSALTLAERTSRESWQNSHAPTLTQYVDVRSGALAGAGSTSNALAQAEAQIVANALTGVSTRCPQPVALYSAPMPCGCPNSCGCNG